MHDRAFEPAGKLQPGPCPVPATGAGNRYGTRGGGGHRRGCLPHDSRHGEGAGLAVLAPHGMGDYRGGRGRRCALLRRAGSTAPGSGRALCLPEGSLRAASGVPLRLAVDAGHRPGNHGRRCGRPGDLCELCLSPFGLGSGRCRGRSDRGAGGREYPRCPIRLGCDSRPGGAQAWRAWLPGALGPGSGARRLVELRTPGGAAAGLEATRRCPDRGHDRGLLLDGRLVGRQQDRRRGSRPPANPSAPPCFWAWPW